jgi:hypothetical protein
MRNSNALNRPSPRKKEEEKPKAKAPPAQCETIFGHAPVNLYNVSHTYTHERYAPKEKKK